MSLVPAVLRRASGVRPRHSARAPGTHGARQGRTARVRDARRTGALDIEVYLPEAGRGRAPAAGRLRAPEELVPAVCVCVRARARARVYVCAGGHAHTPTYTHIFGVGDRGGMEGGSVGMDVGRRRDKEREGERERCEVAEWERDRESGRREGERERSGEEEEIQRI